MQRSYNARRPQGVGCGISIKTPTADQESRRSSNSNGFPPGSRSGAARIRLISAVWLARWIVLCAASQSATTASRFVAVFDVEHGVRGERLAIPEFSVGGRRGQLSGSASGLHASPTSAESPFGPNSRNGQFPQSQGGFARRLIER